MSTMEVDGPDHESDAEMDLSSDISEEELPDYHNAELPIRQRLELPVPQQNGSSAYQEVEEDLDVLRLRALGLDRQMYAHIQPYFPTIDCLEVADEALQKKLRARVVVFGRPESNAVSIFPEIRIGHILASDPVCRLENIPSGIGLDWFLKHRAEMAEYGDEPLKDCQQPFHITRGLIYYHLSDIGFQRLHDFFRLNVAIFLALLVENNKSQAVYLESTELEPNLLNYDGEPFIELPHSAKQFILSYLDAVMEHHNNPMDFRCRNAFIKKWKNVKWDFFKPRAHMTKKLKMETARVKKDWETYLSSLKDELDREEFEHRFGRFINVLIPGGDLGIQRTNSGVDIHEHSKWREEIRPDCKREDAHGNNLYYGGLVAPMPDVALPISTEGKEDHMELEEGEIDERKIPEPVYETYDGHDIVQRKIRTVALVTDALAAVKRVSVVEILEYLENRFGGQSM